MKSTLFHSILVAGVCVSAAWAQQAEKRPTGQTVHRASQQSQTSQGRTLRMPGPEAQNFMLGTWSIKVKYEPTEEMPNGGVGEGKEVWRPGPGGRSVIEEKYEKNARGEIDGFSVGWWDAEWQGQRFVWCANDVPQGCVVPRNVAKWEGDRLVFSEEQEEMGKKVTSAEVFSDITPTSFTQTLYQGESGRELKPTATIQATKFPANKSGQESSTSQALATIRPRPTPEMQKLLNAFSGTWSITENYQPSESMPKGKVSQGKEVYRPGPGALSMIEEYHSTNASGETSGLGVSWWDAKAQGYRAIWCVNSNPRGCIVMAKLAKWEGNQFVLADEWERMRKKIIFKEILSDITPTSFTQTLYQGESGGELRRIITIRAAKLTKAVPNDTRSKRYNRATRP